MALAPELTSIDERALRRLESLSNAPLDSLTPFEKLDRLNFISLSPAEEILINFVEKFNGVWGPKGTGKSMFSVTVAHQLKKLFGLPVVCDFPLSPAFGEYTEIDIDRFIDQIKMVNELTKGQTEAVAKEAVDGLLKTQMKTEDGTALISALDGAVLILDEAYKYLDSRESSSRLVRLVGHWISQMRHFRVTLFLITPHLDMIDKRARRQIDTATECYTDPQHLYDDDGVRFYIPPSQRFTLGLVHDLSADVKFEIDVNVGEGGELYDTYIKTAFRSSLLDEEKED